MGCMCPKCLKICGVIALLIGIAFLLVDLGVWSFWGIKWWTVVFLLAGVVKMGMSCCADCGACAMPSTPAKKR